MLKIKSKETRFDIYLWGTKINSTINKLELFEKFIETSDSFNENPLRRTEPDVIIKLSDKLIFIEVKYLNPNDIKTDKEKFIKYLIPDIDRKELIESGHYELFRNWAFASKLSNGENFELINLAPKKLFSDKNQDKLTQFENSLKSTKGKFVKLSWEDILEKVNNTKYEMWFKNYLNEKINASR